MSDGFMAGWAARLTGLAYHDLDYWARSGFIVPSVAAAAGKGSQRAYSFRDLVALRVARELRDAGISLPALRRVVQYLRESEGLDHPLAEARLVVAGDDVIMSRSDEELLSLLKRPGQTYLTALVNLANVVEELRSAIAA
jgi:DNA-binding transcriptional MerR regulator